MPSVNINYITHNVAGALMSSISCYAVRCKHSSTFPCLPRIAHSATPLFTSFSLFPSFSPPHCICPGATSMALFQASAPQVGPAVAQYLYELPAHWGQHRWLDSSLSPIMQAGNSAPGSNAVSYIPSAHPIASCFSIHYVAATRREKNNSKTIPVINVSNIMKCCARNALTRQILRRSQLRLQNYQKKQILLLLAVRSVIVKNMMVTFYDITEF